MTEAIKPKSKRKLSDNTDFLLQLFQARPRRKIGQLVRIFEDREVVKSSLRTLKRQGYKFTKPSHGELELVQ